jgi:hypothetical protein
MYLQDARLGWKGDYLSPPNAWALSSLGEAGAQSARRSIYRLPDRCSITRRDIAEMRAPHGDYTNGMRQLL